MKVFLPGIRKEELNIQQVGQVVHLVYMGHHRAIELAEEFVSTTCERAQISSGWLTMFFRSNGWICPPPPLLAKRTESLAKLEKSNQLQPKSLRIRLTKFSLDQRTDFVGSLFFP